MEPLLAKLHVLDYVGAFCKPNDIDPFHKFYFTIPSDQPSEQLHHFGALFAWLSTLLGKPFDVPSEFDDPNATAANIVQQCKVLGVSLEQGPNKVKQAYGDVVLSILDTLTSKALAKRNFKPEAPSFPNDNTIEEADVDDEAEVTIDAFDDEVDSDEEAGRPSSSVGYRRGGRGMVVSHGDVDMGSGLSSHGSIPSVSGGVGGSRMSRGAMALAAVSPEDWEKEVARVTPLLKTAPAGMTKDWRVHLAEIRGGVAQLAAIAPQVQSQLSAMVGAVGAQLEKIATRERALNKQVTAQRDAHRTLATDLATARERYDASSGTVVALTDELAQLNRELDETKARMDTVGSAMTDSQPVKTIKTALQRLQSEIKDMELRMGVIQSTLR